MLFMSEATTVASSAYCSHDRMERLFREPHEKPNCSKSGCSITRMNVFMHKLNKRGDDGSPCKTPLSTLTGLVQDSFTPTVMYELL